MSRPLKILFVASEAAPLMKTGGLADVARALPQALHDQGHDVRLVIPCYGAIPGHLKGNRIDQCNVHMDGTEIWGALREAVFPGSEVPVYLIEHDGYFGREHAYGCNGTEYSDNLERFSFFSMALLDAIQRVGWRPDVVHCNDWHTALVPAHLQTTFRTHQAWEGTPTLFTIHNLRYQGDYHASLLPKTGLDPGLFRSDCLEFYGRINLMKAAVKYSTKINTVSRTYAREIQTPAQGFGLDGFLRTRKADISGIVNGIDREEWSPATDKDIPRMFSLKRMEGKKECKRLLMNELGFSNTGSPLFCMVSRLVQDKGIDLLLDSLERVLAHGICVVVLGTGEPDLEARLSATAHRYGEQLALVIGHNEALAHRCYAGSDFLLMPSRTEPCGLSQMYGLAYGAVPIVRKTGGLADTVIDACPANISKGRANGLVFRPMTGEALTRTILRAVRLYRSTAYGQVQATGMREDHSWLRASEAYLRLYRKAISAS